MTLSVAVADDQPVARDRLVALLAGEPDVRMVAAVSSGPDALGAIRQHRPDLAFLDIQMPGLDGFGVVEALDERQVPVIVFVTAHDEHALRAFEAHAIDYLLKPFGRTRFQRALARARSVAEGRRAADVTARLEALVKELRGGAHRGPRLVVRTGGRRQFVEMAHIDWVEAEGNYARLHVGAESFLSRETMAALELRLGASFVRIHRSLIVNIERVRAIHVASGGDYHVLLGDGIRLRLGRSYRDDVERRLAGRKGGPE